MNIKVDLKEVSFMSDFEYGIRKALNEVFKDYGCYFHFVKNLWAKAKKIGLFKKELKQSTSF